MVGIGRVTSLDIVFSGICEDKVGWKFARSGEGVYVRQQVDV